MKKSAALIYAIAIVLFSACAEKVSPTVIVTPNLSQLPYTGGSVDVAVNTIFPWIVTIDEDVDATVSENHGVGSDTITVTVPATESIETSSVKLSITAKNSTGSSVKYVIITLEPKPFIGLDSEKECVPLSGGKFSLCLTANGEWESSCSAAGVVIKPTNDALGVYTLDVTVPATDTARTFTITFTTAEGATATLEIEQK